MGTFDYQFDFAASAAAPQSERDAPQGFPMCAIVGTQMNLQSRRRRRIRRCTSVPQTTRSEVHDEADVLRHAQCLFDVIEMLSTELVIYANSVENAELSVDFLEVLRSELTSTMIAQMIQSEKREKNTAIGSACVSSSSTAQPQQQIDAVPTFVRHEQTS